MVYAVTYGDRSVNGNEEFGLNAFDFTNSGESLEEILLKIEMLQSRVRTLKTRVDKVVSENPGKFSSVNDLCALVPCDTLTTSDEGPSSHENRVRMPVKYVYTSSRRRSGHATGDRKPESAVSSGVEATTVPDMVGLADQLQIEGSRKNVRFLKLCVFISHVPLVLLLLFRKFQRRALFLKC